MLALKTHLFGPDGYGCGLSIHLCAKHLQASLKNSRYRYGGPQNADGNPLCRTWVAFTFSSCEEHSLLSCFSSRLCSSCCSPPSHDLSEICPEGVWWSFRSSSTSFIFLYFENVGIFRGRQTEEEGLTSSFLECATAVVKLEKCGKQTKRDVALVRSSRSSVSQTTCTGSGDPACVAPFTLQPVLRT